MMNPHSILALDVAGVPHRWIGVEQAAQYYGRELVVWCAGETEFVLRGGVQRRTSMQSVIRANSIIAIGGGEFNVRHYNRVAAVHKEMLFARDLHMCAYCGQRLPERELEMEHIYPVSRGGADTWMNLVTACRPCNDRKRARTPEEARMPLLYLPYVPNRHEAFILANRRILADQMEFLMSGVSKQSRVLQRPS